ncbi:PD-(D/E)XK nuclease family protein [Bacillus atrophaeus]|uniref:PD-(D/E)XK nuclease family protein n=1 Tax=Bacillus atrophaeus TaxID=1452 RepID=UPI0022808AFE|nr:PD-(D/E)XK nuclease family protein [Bacillus atrophaeus]MCY7948005.1 PD-(D/E)XK nuclease family protein [Bacillus atrophaeus]MCY8098050.1 PD-(D/E)XK nuclease family protein [Bacillus atrophaeus]MCY9169974.1 PD-(D/E)XK nuclease family protein [Bacillus atrophaeus]MEC0740699.1 PD-(D/E)XK nuclease family protein [Bacillus atrophaeus]MEC0747037.1 PD-(D/E)XK nuclease family protein [Bacillus atrophaeus]
MTRLKREQLNAIKKKMGVEKLWSFSKVSTFDQCSWLYKLKYIDKIRVKGDNCYTYWGTIAHDLIQGYYQGKYKYDQMADNLEGKILEYQLIEDDSLKFPSETEWENYIANLRNYFSNVKPLPYAVSNEKPVLAVFHGKEKYVFQGYIDSEFIIEDGSLVILDYKTSSISGFSGAKLFEKSLQLIIYAMGINQHGRIIEKGGELQKFPLEKIKIRYDMMKYVNVSFVQKNGKEKVTKAERRYWVGKMANQIRKDLEGVGKEIEAIEKKVKSLEKKHNAKTRTEDEKIEIQAEIDKLQSEKEDLKRHDFDILEINEKIEEAIRSNDLSNMPDFVKDKYTVSDCYIDVELTTDVVKEFESKLVSTLDKIIEKENEIDHDEAFERGRIDQGDSFYCNNLCDMKDHCKIYKEYKEHNTMFIEKDNAPNDDELLKMLGL